jgi:hypothetical protein
MKRRLAEDRVGLVVIGVFGAAVVRRRVVELREVEVIVAVAGVERSREQPLEAAGEPVAEGEPALIRILAAALPGRLHSLVVPAALGDDVDHGEKRVAAVDR